MVAPLYDTFEQEIEAIANQYISILKYAIDSPPKSEREMNLIILKIDILHSKLIELGAHYDV